MANEVDQFVKSDVMFIERPCFYNELLNLAHTTGDSVTEALSMSGEYLSGIGDVGGIFQESVVTCSELSLQITRLANKTRDLSRDEIKSLLDMEKCSMCTFNWMESQWKRIVRKAQIGEDTMVFSKLNSQVQAARFVIGQTHTPYRTDRLRGSSPVITTPSGPGIILATPLRTMETEMRSSMSEESSLRCKRENVSLPERTTVKTP